jgi:L,D-transpeptidase catalytic domain/Putative peptidoglycan binding domain
LNRTRVAAVALCLAIGATVGVPSAAWGARGKAAGAGAESVTLKASKTRLTYGRKTLLSGKITPADGGQSIAIVDGDGRRVKGAETNASGEYKVWFGPRRNLSLRAQWLDFTSERVMVRVRPVATVRLGKIKPFARTTVRGNVRPWMSDGAVQLKLNRFGKTVSKRTVRLKNGRWFRTKLYVPKAGSYRAKAIVKSAHHARETARSAARSAAMPRIDLGDRNEYVKMLEKRLRALGYYLPRADRFYDFRTRDAVIAFNKAQRRARVGTYVDAATWKKLQNPRRPKPRHKKPGMHIEIDQTRQLLFVVKKKKVKWILHTSTGAGGATRDGAWRVHRKLAGYSGNRLYYPSYFDGLRAIHGWPEVPTYNASHGCSRVPMWSATWIYGKADIGTRVFVYH